MTVTVTVVVIVAVTVVVVVEDVCVCVGGVWWVIKAQQDNHASFADGLYQSRVGEV